MSYGNYDSYNTTSYGAQGGAGGGGFIPGDGSQNSPSGNKGYGKDTLRPVTIKQLIDAQPMHQEGEFKVDGAEITTITVVGQIRNISVQTTNITYKLDDGTGTIEVKKWVDSDAAQNGSETKLADNMYVRAWGKLKSYGNKRHVGATVIRPIADHNEISYHLLEATVVHLELTRGPPDSASKGANTNGAQGYQQLGYGAADDMGPTGGMSATAKKVYQCLKTTPQTNEGLHQQDIAARLNLDIAEVSKAGDDLLQLGVIYTTVDDVTWAVLEMD
ncbi:replication factor A2 [Mytilinidion resinicola]|uniref:Replication factor A2 n=1 Tax=Mytilinidion resinicola TaxID=574789 RepID=A0A6A6YXH8_9PEZI|nr:replication factor A2 [Mytilinidion resinicola]KAF2813199.1 replication factor A2 [Mytilinidion resinicola]